MAAGELPDAAEWDGYGNLGDEIVRQAISDAMTQLSRQGASRYAPLAVGMGAIKAVGDYLRIISNPDAAHVLEQNALAYLRGALRGADGPVLDNGQPFTGAHDG